MVYQIDPPSTHLVDLPIRFFYQNQYLRVQTPCAQDIVAAMEVHWSPNGWGWNDPVKQEFDLRDVLFVIFLENPIDDLWRLLVGTQTPPRFSRCFIWLFFYTPLQIHSTGASQVCMYIYIYVYTIHLLPINWNPQKATVSEMVIKISGKISAIPTPCDHSMTNVLMFGHCFIPPKLTISTLIVKIFTAKAKATRTCSAWLSLEEVGNWRATVVTYWLTPYTEN